MMKSIGYGRRSYNKGRNWNDATRHSMPCFMRNQPKLRKKHRLVNFLEPSEGMTHPRLTLCLNLGIVTKSPFIVSKLPRVCAGLCNGSSGN